MAFSILAQSIIFQSADGLTNYSINAQSSMKAGWSSGDGYYIRVTSIDGIYGADIASESHPIPHAIGEVSGDTYRKGKGISINGTIEGRNLSRLAAARNYLRQMFWETALRKLIWTEYDGTQVYLKCRVLNDLNVTETYDKMMPVWTWTVGLRADDPRERKVSDDTLFYAWMT